MGVPAYASALMANVVEDAPEEAAIAPTPIKPERHAAEVIPISAAHHHAGAHHGTPHAGTAELPYPNHLQPSALA